MILEYGVIIFVGLLFIALKLPPRYLLRMLAYPVAIDIGVTVLVFVLHWGTLGGTMAAAFAGLITSVATTLGRKIFGYIESNQYFRGLVTFTKEELE